MCMRVGLAAVVAVVFGWVASAAGAVTPGWECVPTAVGGAVVSGGTGASPSCGSNTTSVLAPTFVTSGVGGKPTVAFSTVNVQVVSGSGSTAGTVNGKGNLVVGYAENPEELAQTGSNDLIVGSGNGWKGYGEIVGGANNQASGAYSTALGLVNVASNEGATAIGGQANTASGFDASVFGGEANVASDQEAAVIGGCENLAGPGTQPSFPCSSGQETVAGGFADAAKGLRSFAAGGNANIATGFQSSVLGGFGNHATFPSGSSGSSGAANMTTVGGNSNIAKGDTSSVLGGLSNIASGTESAILGGHKNSAATNCETIPTAPNDSC